MKRLRDRRDENSGIVLLEPGTRVRAKDTGESGTVIRRQRGRFIGTTVHSYLIRIDETEDDLAPRERWLVAGRFDVLPNTSGKK